MKQKYFDDVMVMVFEYDDPASLADNGKLMEMETIVVIVETTGRSCSLYHMDNMEVCGNCGCQMGLVQQED